jgi:hypothetical protein
MDLMVDWYMEVMDLYGGLLYMEVMGLMVDLYMEVMGLMVDWYTESTTNELSGGLVHGGISYGTSINILSYLAVGGVQTALPSSQLIGA